MLSIPEMLPIDFPLNIFLAFPRYGKRLIGHIPRDDGTSAYEGSRTDGHGRNKGSIAANEGIFAYMRLKLVLAVIVAGDGARADVRTGPYLGITEVREVIGLRPFAETGFLELDKIADMRIRLQLGP